jgi:flavin-dependent dehydrogenase
VEALAQRARESGAVLRHHTAVRSHRKTGEGVFLETDEGEVQAKLLVAADGLDSPLRRAEGLDLETQSPHRFGLRQHFRQRPWTDFVEVHLSDWAEAYVTPVGPECVGVALLWEQGKLDKPISWETVSARFPILRKRIKGGALDAKPRGAGPLARAAKAQVAERFVLIGDAAGYVDAITGEGLSLAFGCAAALGRLLPAALARGGKRESLRQYERDFWRLFSRYAWVTRAVLTVCRHPGWRHKAVRGLSNHPRAFDRLLQWFV